MSRFFHLLLVGALLGLGLETVRATTGLAPAMSAPLPSSLTLTDCERLALKHNPDLLTASTQFLDAEGRIIKYRAILYPSITSQQLSTPLTFYVQINQVFYSHQSVARVRLSHLVRDEPFINYRQTLNDVVFTVRQAFVATLAAQAHADLLHDFTRQRDKDVALAGQLFNAGKAQRSDILSLQVRSNLARQNATLADLAQTQALLKLGQALGIDLPSATRVQGQIAAPAIPTQLDPAQLTAQALRDRDDLKLLTSLQLVGAQEIEVTQSAAYPVIGFSSDSAIQPPAFGPTGSYDLERNYDDPATERVSGNTQLPLSLYFTWTIFDGGNLRGQRASAEAALMSKETALEELRTSIPGEVSGAVAGILNEQETLRNLAAGESPEKLRQAAQLDYEAGRVRQLDLADLDSAVLQHEELRLSAETRLTLAVAALDHALGRGLEAPLTTTAR